MQKIIILGCAGSGKSTFARKLHDLTGIPLVHLDNLWWKSDRTHITREEFDAALIEILQGDVWIIDGDYSRTYEVRVKAADTIFFLDYSEEDCLSGIQARMGRERPDMPWTENEVDPELVEMVRRYRKENRPAIMKLLREAREKQIHIFCNREEADTWLAEQTETTADDRFDSVTARILCVHKAAFEELAK